MKDEFKMKLKKIGIIALIVSILSLIIGASFHGYRMHPEDVQTYNIGVAMGIAMASIAGIVILFGVFPQPVIELVSSSLKFIYQSMVS